MKKILTQFLIIVMLLPGISLGADSDAYSIDDIRDFINNLFSDNAEYVSEISHEDFKTFAEQQTPRATIVACSDSRVQSNAFHKSPINDLFTIRNIGNQISNAEGSVEYGVNHLHTPLLLIIGHSHCGAIIAALGDYRKQPKAIRKELHNLQLRRGINPNTGVIDNVNMQVKYALKKFKDKVAKKELVVVGTVYDFRDDFGHGHGRLILINVNGETNPAKIKKHDYIKGFDHIPIGLKKKK